MSTAPIIEDDNIGASGTAMIELLGGSVKANQWIREMSINASDWGDANTTLVFAPVWDAVRRNNLYWLGAWTDTVFLPEKMSEYMPHLGEGDELVDPDGNFHCGVRISTLVWANLIVISRPDPAGEAYVVYLYKNEDPKSPGFGKYKVYKWTYTDPTGKLHERANVIPVSELTQYDIDVLLGFDPWMAIEDEGWYNRLAAEGKDPTNTPATLFVLQGRNGQETFLGNDPTNRRPLTRSYYNDRIWKSPVTTWAWEIGNPAQRDHWAIDAPDGITTTWKMEAATNPDGLAHQWRRNNGLSHMFRPYDEAGNKRLLIEETVRHPDGTLFEVYVIDPDYASLDNTQYNLSREGGFVIDFIGENYHSGVNLSGFGVFNAEVAKNTFIRIVPGTRKLNGGIGTFTDPQRANLMWTDLPTGSGVSVMDRKLEEWKYWFNHEGGMPQSLLDLLEDATFAGTDDGKSLDDLADLAHELGDLFKVTKIEDREVIVPGPKAPPTRRKRRSIVCPECSALLPFPGHVEGCSRKPAPPEPKPVEPGKLDHDGDPEKPKRGRKGAGDGPPVTVIRPIEVESGMDFPEVHMVDQSTLAPPAFLYTGWMAPSPAHPRGVVMIGWGNPKGKKERHPILETSCRRVASRWGVKPGTPKFTKVEEAVWRTIQRIVASEMGHVKGQADAYDVIGRLWDEPDNEAFRWGLQFGLLGIEHIERLAVPLLRKTLGKQLGSTPTAKKAPAKKTA